MNTSGKPLQGPRIMCLADLPTKGGLSGGVAETALRLLSIFSSRSSDRLANQCSIMRMTSLLIESRRPFESSSLVLMPVMRAGLAMWVEANELFNAPQTVFVWARKDKRGRHVNLVSAPVEIPDGRDVLLFDPI